MQDSEEVGMEILSLDKGLGMKDTGEMLTDGISSLDSTGHGLGSIKRLSHTFDMYSYPGVGTYILARVYKNESSLPGLSSTERTKFSTAVFEIETPLYMLVGAT